MRESNFGPWTRGGRHLSLAHEAAAAPVPSVRPMRLDSCAYRRALASYEWISVLGVQSVQHTYHWPVASYFSKGGWCPVQGVDFKTVAFVRSATLPKGWYRSDGLGARHPPASQR
jgi:hypothetical protein